VIIMETGNHCYDYIVVGLGTAGSATCLELARRRVSVLGIDAHRPPHRLGSHHGASRSIRRAYLEGSAYVPMAMRSWQLWRKLEKDATIDLLVTTGNLTIGPPYSPAVAGFLASARKYQIEHEQLTARQVMERFPCFTMPEDFVAGLEVEAGIIFPETAITTILTQAHQSGATLHFNEQVESWQETAGGVIVQTTQGPIRGRTSSGQRRCVDGQTAGTCRATTAPASGGGALAGGTRCPLPSRSPSGEFLANSGGKRCTDQ
jgi:sarcosine oxidase